MREISCVEWHMYEGREKITQVYKRKREEIIERKGKKQR